MSVKNDYASAFYSYIKEVNKRAFLSDEEERAIGKEINKIRTEELTPYLCFIKKACKKRLEQKAFDKETIGNIRHILKLLPITIGKDKIVLQQKRLIEFLFPQMVWKKGKPIWGKSSLAFKENWENFVKGKSKLKSVANPLVESNLRLVINMAKAYINILNEVELIDLVQEGNIGMMRSALTWDYKKSKFTTYAFHWIRQGITRALSTQNEQHIYFPVHINSTMHTIISHAIKLEQELERFPTDKELADDCKLPLPKLKKIKGYMALKKSIVKLDTPTGEAEGSTIQDFVADVNAVDASEEVFRKQKLDKIKSILSIRLTTKEASVITERFIDEKKLREVGDERNLTRERIRQIEFKALKKLRHPSQLQNLIDLCENA
jgi:RNA polymerase primary sigma factor